MALQHRKVKREITDLETLQTLTKVYAEIAAMKMKKKREAVLYTRQFLAELNEVFTDVRIAYINELKRLAEIQGKSLQKSVTMLSHNGKTVAVFFAANTRLYGDIIMRTYEQFIEDVKVAGSEATIVGKVGATLFEQNMGDKPYTYFDMPDQEIDVAQVKKIVKHLVPYEEIHLYYGRFMNVVKQEPTMYTISAQIPLDQNTARVKKFYMFEPTIEAVLQYFEGQIFGTLFEQALAESQLAKYAARLTAMDRAEVQIGERLKKTMFLLQREKHSSLNRQMLNESVGRILYFDLNH